MSSNPKWSDLLSRDRGRTIAAANQLLPAWVSLVIVILIGWQLARIVWMFVPGTGAGDPVSAPAGVTMSAPPTDGDAQSAARSIADANLFGIADAEPADTAALVPVEQENYDETDKNLKLKGTHMSADAAFSIAIISDGSNDDKVYGVGDPVVSGVTLHEVRVDSVVLNENGTLTSLNLPKDFPDSAPAPTRRNTATRATAQRQSIQSVVAQNVSRLADVIRPTPYFVNGQQQGYRVYPGRNRRQFAALGLRPGDLIKDIDGQALNDPTQAMQIFQSLGTAQQVSVTVVRDGTPETLVLKTDQLDLAEEQTK